MAEITIRRVGHSWGKIAKVIEHNLQKASEIKNQLCPRCPVRMGRHGTCNGMEIKKNGIGRAFIWPAEIECEVREVGKRGLCLRKQ